MIIVHEINQLAYGGVERIIRNIIAFDKKNEHIVCSYKDGPFRKELEAVGAKVIIATEEDISVSADIIHIHSGGAASKMAKDLSSMFPVIETIHSPVRSAVLNKDVFQRVGVCKEVSRINHDCITILNGLDFYALHPTKHPEEIKKELGIPEGVPVIGRLGRVARDKGLEEWILACADLQKKGFNFTPLIVGEEFEPGYRGTLKLMCESLPLKNVIWVGHRDDVGNLYQIIDIFLYPSATEGFGLVFAEALYSGCQVVTWNTPVTRELFGGVAFMAEKANIAELSEVTEMVLRSTEVEGDARPLLEEHYSGKRMSEQYQELYESSYENFIKENKPQAEHLVSA